MEKNSEEREIESILVKQKSYLNEATEKDNQSKIKSVLANILQLKKWQTLISGKSLTGFMEWVADGKNITNVAHRKLVLKLIRDYGNAK